MARVIGIDPGTVSIDLCGLDHGRVFLDRTIPTARALADPQELIRAIEAAGPCDLIAGPSGYGLPLVRAQDASDDDLRLAFLGAPDESGGIGGLRSLARELAHSALPIVFTPGVIHLASVPEHRKVNRVDMGTADKVAVAALAIDEQARRAVSPHRDVSLVLLELGGAFSAAIGVAGGRIVDGTGGTSGPMGFRAAGALDGEAAFLAGAISKDLLFRGGAASVAAWDGDAGPERLANPATERERVAVDALIESAVKAAAAVALSVPALTEFVVSGRLARIEPVRQGIARRLEQFAPTRVLQGFAPVAKEGAQGAALLADGLAEGEASNRELVATLGLRAASGTVLDHLFVVSPAAARGRLGLS
jgi:predicted butyrate kinase (DUF1464 family)